MGFSHTHLSGTGFGEYGDVLIMPTVGPLHLQPGDRDQPDAGYRSRFSHERESASPGYYSVYLDDYKITAELTVTKRVGFHRYTFPQSDSSHIIIDPTHFIYFGETIGQEVEIVGDSDIQGYCVTGGWAHNQKVYFAMTFSRPFDSFGTAVNDTWVTPSQRLANGAGMGTNVKGFVTYKTTDQEQILVKVGISAVSIEGARKNSDVEIPDWDFNRVREEANDAWNTKLSKIQVEGGTKDQRTIFYTAMYHSLIAPNLFMDVDGSYLGFDQKIHVAKDFNNYTLFSLWDTFRATHPLYTIIEPEVTADFIKSLLAKAQEGGGSIPIWPIWANYTGIMIGYHYTSVIADAYLKGIGGFDIDKAYEAMLHQPGRRDYPRVDYEEKGYMAVLPYENEHDNQQTVSKTLEYSYDDWCIAQLAKKLGKHQDYQRFSKRAGFYKNLFDPSIGFMRPRKPDGTWVTPFNPKQINEHSEFTEGNTWQYTWYVPHDVDGLSDLMGGDEKFIAKLDALFDESSELVINGKITEYRGDMSGYMGQYVHGNEPSHHITYLYSYAGAAWKTQERVRQMMDQFYTAKPDGLCGNEDCGQMSSWFVFSAMGFYPVCPGSNVYVIGSPIFNKVTIDSGNGKSFVLKAVNCSSKNKYIQSATMNGRPYNRSYLRHSDIVSGSELILKMASKPDKGWAAEKKSRP